MSRKLLVLLVASLIGSSVACGDDDTDHAHDAGIDSGVKPSAGKGGGGAGRSGAGGAGAGGKAGTASAGTSAAAGASGAAGMMSMGDPYKCKPAAAEKGGTKAAGEQCCGGMGMCTKNPSGTAASGYGLDDCKAGSDLKCVPMLGAGDDAGTPAIASCKADIPKNLIGDVELEGRCVPSCFTTGDPSSANLGQSSCDKGSKCVPCYSPVTGKSTGACEQGGDKPSKPAPTGFPSCGDHDIGYCIPTSAAMTAGNVMLPQLNCADGHVCAPKLRVLDQSACFAHCESGVGGPGACIASFIIPDSSRSFLMKATCADGELCTPCVSPLDQSETGACN